MKSVKSTKTNFDQCELKYPPIVRAIAHPGVQIKDESTKSAGTRCDAVVHCISKIYEEGNVSIMGVNLVAEARVTFISRQILTCKLMLRF
jgi:hypothetical protein